MVLWQRLLPLPSKNYAPNGVNISVLGISARALWLCESQESLLQKKKLGLLPRTMYNLFLFFNAVYKIKFVFGIWINPFSTSIVSTLKYFVRLLSHKHCRIFLFFMSLSICTYYTLVSTYFTGNYLYLFTNM